MTMNPWRSGQDQECCNLSKISYDAYINDGVGEGSAKFSSGSYKYENSPSKLKAVSFLLNQLEALLLLLCDN